MLGPLRSHAADTALQRFAFEKAEMGVPFRITLFAPDVASGKAAADAAFARVELLNSILSDYDPDSEVSRLSQSSGQSKVVPVSSVLWRVLEPAQALSERTNGAFDVTAGPVVSLWRRARREKALPKPELLREFLARVGFQKLRLDGGARTAELLVPDMRLDLGGIAKGFAAEEALAVLRLHGSPCALVAASGDMAAGDPPPGEAGWRVEVAALDFVGAPAAQVILLKNRAIATSGDVFQRVEVDGRRYSHVVDPRTGYGITDHSLVTVVAPDCLTADSLATAVSVLGPEAGLRLIEQTPRTAAYIVRKPEEQVEVRKSAAWEKELNVPSDAMPSGGE